MVALQVYVSGAVESWTVAGAFGQRRFVAMTILLVVGLAALRDATARTDRARAPAERRHRGLRLVEPGADGGVRHAADGPPAARAAPERVRCVRDAAAHGARAALSVLRAPFVVLQACRAARDSRRPRLSAAHPLLCRHPVSARAGQRHSDDGDVSCARGARPRTSSSIVRPDTQTPGARSLRVLRPAAVPDGCSIEARAGERTAGRAAAWLSCLCRRSRGRARGRATIVITRDLGVASLLLRLPRAPASAARLRVARLRP